MRRKLLYMSVDEAVKKMITTVNIKPDFEVVPIHEAYGRVLAEDVIPMVDLHPWDSLHFDGYAVSAEDTIRLLGFDFRLMASTPFDKIET